MEFPYHPFRNIPTRVLVPIFLVLVFLTVFVMYYLLSLGGPLVTESVPYGIISFEFAWNMERVHEIMQDWGTAARTNAQFSLLIDYLFLILYSTTIGTGCILIAKNVNYSSSFQTLGNDLAWLQWLAALLDAVENAALFSLLTGADSMIYPQIAFWMALMKFLIILAGLVYCIAGLAFLFFDPKSA